MSTSLPPGVARPSPLTVAQPNATAATLLTSAGCIDELTVLMVYAYTLSNTTVTPDVDYVRRVTSVGMEYSRAGKIAGVIQ